MTTEALTPRESQDPLIEDEKPRDVLAEVRALLLLAHGLNKEIMTRRMMYNKKKAIQNQIKSHVDRANQLIAEHYGLSLDNPDDHLALVSRRATLRREALEHDTSRASYEVGKKAYETAKRASSELPDAKMRAAHDID